jgi:two-component system response regulator PilR (NtrC family)
VSSPIQDSCSQIIAAVPLSFLSCHREVFEELQVKVSVQHNRHDVTLDAELCQAHAALIEFEDFDAQAASFINSIRTQAPAVPVIALLGRPSFRDSACFIDAGVFGCLGPASSAEEIRETLAAAITKSAKLRQNRVEAVAEAWRSHLVGTSEAIEKVAHIMRLVASRRSTVLIGGETGTGKEVAARAIHMASDRAKRPFVAVNCGAIPENLIEAELFGHAKGAFTGAVGSRSGRFEQAEGGTIFLDEIGDLPFELQAKLLRVLQEREIHRLGGSDTVKINVRVIAATNADLPALIAQRRFREDLYYRLNVVPVHMPPLRERLSDIPLLVNHFIRKICSVEGISPKQVSPATLDALRAYHWPGNVRQLENVMEHAVVMSGEEAYISDSHLSLPKPHTLAKVMPIAAESDHLPDEGFDFCEALRRFEEAIIRQAMSRTQGNKTRAADLLRLPRTTFIHKLRMLEMGLTEAVA